MNIILKKTYWKPIILWGLGIGGAVNVAFLIFLFLIFIGVFGKIPSSSEIKSIKNHTASIVYSSDNRMIGKYYLQNRVSINNDKISPHAKQALIATEDSRFFERKGLDFISIGRVILKSVLMQDSRQGGGSTISQQLAKNLFPRSSSGFLSLPINKIKESIVASRLEKSYTKEEILAIYLNTVPFGEDVYGIEVASNRFFSKPSQELSIVEAATLIGMLAANTAYNPRLHPERALQRRNLVLKRMADNTYITPEEAETLAELPIVLNYSRIDISSSIAPHFLEKVRQECETILHQRYGNTYNIYTQGLKIYTTLDYDLQTYANEAVRQHLTYLQHIFNTHWKHKQPWDNHPTFLHEHIQQTKRYKSLAQRGLDDKAILIELAKPLPITLYTADGEITKTMSPIDSLKISLKLLQAGFVAINPSNGHIVAWNGAANFRQSQFDHVTSNRQVGSVFKPFVYAAALNKGFAACDFFSNEAKTYSDDWTPTNADGKHEGYYSLKGGLIHSINTTAAQIIDSLGVDDVLALTQKLGIDAAIPPVPSIALGTAELSLLDMTAAYTAFPNYGYAVNPTMVLKIENAEGEVLYEHKNIQKLSEAFTNRTAQLMVEMLKEVTTKGTAQTLYTTYALKNEYAGKTGTTQNNSDGWFIGFSPNLVVGVWVGADSPLVRFRTTQLGQGAHTAMPIFARFMKKIETNKALSKRTTTQFAPLPDSLSDYFTCEDYVEQLATNKGLLFFDRLFNPKKKTKPAIKQKPKKTKKQKHSFKRKK